MQTDRKELTDIGYLMSAWERQLKVALIYVHSISLYPRFCLTLEDQPPSQLSTIIKFVLRLGTVRGDTTRWTGELINSREPGHKTGITMHWRSSSTCESPATIWNCPISSKKELHGRGSRTFDCHFLLIDAFGWWEVLRCEYTSTMNIIFPIFYSPFRPRYWGLMRFLSTCPEWFSRNDPVDKARTDTSHLCCRQQALVSSKIDWGSSSTSGRPDFCILVKSTRIGHFQ